MGWSPQTTTSDLVFPLHVCRDPSLVSYSQKHHNQVTLEEGTTFWASQSLSTFILRLFRYRLQQLNALARLWESW